MFLIVQRFGELIRKLWNPRNFKAHVSPHEMLQSVVLCSKKKFQITEQGAYFIFVLWLPLSSKHSVVHELRGHNCIFGLKAFMFVHVKWPGPLVVVGRGTLLVRIAQMERAMRTCQSLHGIT